MMSKEQRAYLQGLLDGHSNGHPLWRTFGDDETDIGRVRGHQSIRGFHGDTLGSFYTAELATLATEAVNALQELLDTLDVTELALATAREDASEMEKKAIAEGSEALALKAEVDRLNMEVSLTRMERDTARNAEKVGALESLPRTITLQIPDAWLTVVESNLNASIAEMETVISARIVELETEQGELHRALATAREDASEMEKKAIAEGSEALALRAEVAALKAAARYDAWLLSGDTGMSSKAIFHFMRLGAKGGWTPSDPSDLGRCLRLLERFPEWRERMPEMANCSPKWARMMPYWDVLEASLLREVGGIHTDGSAPETFQMMKAIERGNIPTLPTGDGQ
jgi:hypothetical protein